MGVKGGGKSTIVGVGSGVGSGVVLEGSDGISASDEALGVTRVVICEEDKEVENAKVGVTCPQPITPRAAMARENRMFAPWKVLNHNLTNVIPKRIVGRFLGTNDVIVFDGCCEKK
jgi:hypothetical protein